MGPPCVAGVPPSLAETLGAIAPTARTATRPGPVGRVSNVAARPTLLQRRVVAVLVVVGRVVAPPTRPPAPPFASEGPGVPKVHDVADTPSVTVFPSRLPPFPRVARDAHNGLGVACLQVEDGRRPDSPSCAGASLPDIVAVLAT